MIWQENEPPASLISDLKKLFEPAKLSPPLQAQRSANFPPPSHQETQLLLVEHKQPTRRGTATLGIAAAIVGGLAGFEIAVRSKNIAEGLLIGTAVGLLTAGLFMRRNRPQPRLV